ncbi:MAG: DUF2059 domain-containing protein [Caulobacterales bacterium]
MQLGLLGACAPTSDSSDAQGERRRFSLAMEYLQLTHRQERLNESYPDLVSRSSNSCTTDACRQDLVADYRAATAANSGEFVEKVALLWANTMTERELQDALAFAASPSGKSILNKELLIIDREDALQVELGTKIRRQVRSTFCAKRPRDCIAPPSPKQ